MSRPYWLPISIGRLLRARRSLPGTGKAKIHAKRRALTVPAHRRSHGGTQERLQQTHFYTSPNCPAYAYTYTYQVDHRPRRESSSAPRKALPLQEGYSPFLMQPGGFPRTVLTVSIPPPLPPYVTASPDGLPVSLVVGALIPASLTRRRKHV